MLYYACVKIKLTLLVRFPLFNSLYCKPDGGCEQQWKECCAVVAHKSHGIENKWKSEGKYYISWLNWLNVHIIRTPSKYNVKLYTHTQRFLAEFCSNNIMPSVYSMNGSSNSRRESLLNRWIFYFNSFYQSGRRRMLDYEEHLSFCTAFMCDDLILNVF